MRREGSPWAGLGTVVTKESVDHLGSTRMRLMEILIGLTAAGAIYGAISHIRESVGQDVFLFLTLFTTGHNPVPSFTGFIGFLVPLIAIALGFDAINSEYSRRTLGRVLAQPIYRDALILGKFLGALFTLTIVLVSLWLLVTGLGLLLLGLPPSGEEVARAAVFLLVTIAYGAVWLTMAMLFSTLFRQPATAALAALSLWLVLTVFWPMLASGASSVLAAHDPNPYLELANQVRVEQAISRLSPNTLYSEAVLALLHPETRALGPVFYSQLEGAILGSPLPLGESVLLIWPHLTGLIAASVLLFTMTYVNFQRQEIRA